MDFYVPKWLQPAGSPWVSAPSAHATTRAAISRGRWLPARLTAPVSAAFSHPGQRTSLIALTPNTFHPLACQRSCPPGARPSVPTTACSLQVRVLHDPRVGLCPPGPRPSGLAPGALVRCWVSGQGGACSSLFSGQPAGLTCPGCPVQTGPSPAGLAGGAASLTVPPVLWNFCLAGVALQFPSVRGALLPRWPAVSGSLGAAASPLDSPGPHSTCQQRLVGPAAALPCPP